MGAPDADPDYALYCFGEPNPKQSTWQIALAFIVRMVGGKVVSILHKSERLTQSPQQAPQVAKGNQMRATLFSRVWAIAAVLWPIIVVQTLLLLAFTFAFGWHGYFILWFLPLATLASFYNDFRIFCEHSVAGRDPSDKDERMFSFISNPVERFFIAPNHMSGISPSLT